MVHNSHLNNALKNAFNLGISLENFLGQADFETQRKMRFFFENTDFSLLKSRKDIPAIDTSKIILFFGDLWCPDCVINSVAVKGLTNIFPGLKVRVLSRDGNEEIIKLLGDQVKAKIPTIVVMSQTFEPLGVFVERPEIIRELEQTDDQVQRIIMMRDYREGKFIADAASEIYKILKEDNL